jgi:hypothetical protein
MREAVSCSVLECQQPSKQKLAFRLSLEDIRGLLRKYKDNMSWFLGGLYSKPLFPPTIQYKISFCTQITGCWLSPF